MIIGATKDHVRRGIVKTDCKQALPVRRSQRCLAPDQRDETSDS